MQADKGCSVGLSWGAPIWQRQAPWLACFSKQSGASLRGWLLWRRASSEGHLGFDEENLPVVRLMVLSMMGLLVFIPIIPKQQWNLCLESIMKKSFNGKLWRKKKIYLSLTTLWLPKMPRYIEDENWCCPTFVFWTSLVHNNPGCNVWYLFRVFPVYKRIALEDNLEKCFICTRLKVDGRLKELFWFH